MPYNGSGVFSLVAGNPVVTGTIISSTWANNTLADIANNGLSSALTKDGQQTPTANIPLGGFRVTGVGNAAARTDAPNAGQIQDGTLTTLNGIAGTDTITSINAPAITAYAAGQCFDFIAAGSNTTNAVTLNINALGAKNVTRNGSTALTPGDIQTGASVRVRYDGTQFQMISPIGGGRLLSIRTFSANTTYTPTAGTNSIKAKLVGGGGGGGAQGGAGAGQVSLGTGGGAGAYAEAYLTSGFSGAAITIGAAGTPGVSGGGNGGNGGTTSLGALVSAVGGTGGTGQASPVSTFPVFASGSPGGSTTSGANLISAKGGDGPIAGGGSTTSVISGSGGTSAFGAGGSARASGGVGSGAGNASPSAGGGGGGALALPGAGSAAGGAGGSGYMIVEEYS